jgi:hypothetical protein
MLKPTLVAELRRLFLDGATPSQLMHCIELDYPDNPRLHFIIKDYFEEAFQLPLLRNVIADGDYSPDPRHAHFNRDIVPEIIQRIEDWNTESLDASWLKGIVVRSLSGHVERLSATRFEELDRVWDTLND